MNKESRMKANGFILTECLLALLVILIAAMLLLQDLQTQLLLRHKGIEHELISEAS